MNNEIIETVKINEINNLINCNNFNVNTCFIQACKYNRLDIIKHLLKNYNIKQELITNSLATSCNFGKIYFVKEFLKIDNIDTTGALYNACHKGSNCSLNY